MNLASKEYQYLKELLKINPKLTVAQATKRLELLHVKIGEKL